VADVSRPISRILVANRGEIARRIIRTAHELGIGTVAVYADADADAPYVREADTAIALGGRSSTETYLDIPKVIEACRQSGADAVHPGYGFLSENERFAQAVVDEGVRWIGPAPRVIGLMGDKLSAKRLMVEAGVPTLPAVEITEATDLAEAASQIGYPVLVKASAGGGGRGMRVVEDEGGLADAVLGAKREAASSFGDDTVFFEKWLESSRHVEVQILGDGHGNVLHCFERECSIQRRHQKIIEEAPSPAVTPEIRDRMGAAAVAAAKKLGYTSAGTVEFLLSGDEFYFLEVNARLQVEHPVTEAVIGWDLVREQIRVAEGERLSFTRLSAVTGHRRRLGAVTGGQRPFRFRGGVRLGHRHRVRSHDRKGHRARADTPGSGDPAGASAGDDAHPGAHHQPGFPGGDAADAGVSGRRHHHRFHRARSAGSGQMHRPG
jgi:acetyl/propionyl-CoA carboxylase alpha subunit